MTFTRTRIALLVTAAVFGGLAYAAHSASEPQTVIPVVASATTKAAMIEQACKASGAIPDCVEVLSGRKKVVYTPAGKLDFGPSNPVTVVDIQNTPVYRDLTPDERDNLNISLQANRDSYGIAVANRQLRAANEHWRSVYERRLPFNGMSHDPRY